MTNRLVRTISREVHATPPGVVRGSLRDYTPSSWLLAQRDWKPISRAHCMTELVVSFNSHEAFMRLVGSWHPAKRQQIETRMKI